MRFSGGGPLAAVVVILVSGCLGRPVGVDLSPEPGSGTPRTWGLGLTLPEDLPEPGPFREDPADVAKLTQFLAENAGAVAAPCEAATLEPIHDSLAAGLHLRAVSLLFDACVDSVNSDALAQEALAAGTTASTYDALRREATHALNRTRAELGNVSRAGSVAEAELLGYFMEQHLSTYGYLDTAASYYKRGTADPSDLALAYNNLQLAQAYTNVTSHFLAKYNWTASNTCDSPDSYVLASRMRPKVDFVSQLGARYSPPEHANYISTPYGLWVKYLGPWIEQAAAEDWWPFLLRIETRLDWDLAAWLVYTQETLPNEAEARFLVAAYRNQTRTFTTEARLDYLFGEFEDAFPWERIEWNGLYAMTVGSLSWTFASLECHA